LQRNLDSSAFSSKLSPAATGGRGDRCAGHPDANVLVKRVR